MNFCDVKKCFDSTFYQHLHLKKIVLALWFVVISISRKKLKQQMETKTCPSASAEIISSPRALNTMETKTWSKSDYNVRTINPNNRDDNDDAFILLIISAIFLLMLLERTAGRLDIAHRQHSLNNRT